MEPKYLIQNALDFIEDNLCAEFEINELCNNVGYSYVHFCRLFQLYVGMSPSAYINRRKLLYAVFDIKNGSGMSDTALKYGYESYSGFYKAFKREFNCSPSAFIRSHCFAKPYRINLTREEHFMVSKEIIRQILTHWNLQDCDVINIYNSNTGRQSENAYYVGANHIVKFTNNLGVVNKVVMLAGSLSAVGIPTAKIIKTIKKENYLQSGELYFYVTSRIKGFQLKVKDIFADPQFTLQIGKNMAKLHIALKQFDGSIYKDTNIYSDCLEILPAIKDELYLSDSFICNYTKTFGELYDALPKQPIHRDLCPTNMLFDNGRFSGFVDFDLAEVNLRIFDICYCATAILSECFGDASIDKEKWKNIYQKLIEGYEIISPLNNEEKQALPYVIYSIQMICIHYFGKMEKYEELYKTNLKMLNFLKSIL